MQRRGFVKILKCEMCGEVNLLKIDGEFVCQSCRTRYTPEEARKLLVEGSVTIDRSREVDNFVTLGLRSYEKIDMRDEAHDEARQYFKRALEIEPENIKAYLYLNMLDFSAARSVELARKSYDRVKELTFAQHEDAQQQSEALLDVVRQYLVPAFNIPIFYNNDLTERVRIKREEIEQFISLSQNTFARIEGGFLDDVSIASTLEVRRKYASTVSFLRVLINDVKKYVYDYQSDAATSIIYEMATSCLVLLDYMRWPIEYLEFGFTGTTTRTAKCSEKGLASITKREEKILSIIYEIDPDFEPSRESELQKVHRANPAPRGIDYEEYKLTKKYDPFSLQ